LVGTKRAQAVAVSEQSEQLKERCMTFAVSVLALIERFPQRVGAPIVARQLAKSATSVGANYRAVCTARSDAEFVSKLCIVNEEVDEVVYWLEIAVRCKFLAPFDLDPPATEARELRAIFGRSLKTIRQRLRTRPSTPNDQMTK